MKFSSPFPQAVHVIVIMSLNPEAREEITILRQILDEIDYAEFYRTVRGHLFHHDPWRDYDCSVRDSGGTAKQEIFSAIFLRGGAVLTKDFISNFSGTRLDALLRTGLLHKDGATVVSAFTVIYCFDNYVVLEKPTTYYQGKVFSSATYLDAASFHFAKRLKSDIAHDAIIPQVLEIGCGSGIQLLIASTFASRVLGIDIDPDAVRVAKFNLVLNNCEQKAHVAVGDMFDALESHQRFQLIFFNPNYRIVPPTISFPNPQARVGPGRDGLDTIRNYLNGLDSHLASNGEAIFECDFPASQEAVPFVKELEMLAWTYKWNVTVTKVRTIPAEQMVRVTAEKCAFLNPQYQFEQVKNVIGDYYADLGVYQLEHCWVSIKRAHLVKFVTDTTSTRLAEGDKVRDSYTGKVGWLIVYEHKSYDRGTYIVEFEDGTTLRIHKVNLERLEKLIE